MVPHPAGLWVVNSPGLRYQALTRTYSSAEMADVDP